ncbi:hypothetical protein A3A79_04750 [Candidatus Gottesmanbacteria bacterium RIFCSPLOWO2_01_FULL_43_11b]|uniref:DUF5667 domain-containing protein n=1 Tax=Candidatus Gottesmanbacteria bacterium RIFCSPLOWO2_01_FULL_43_11b TaxID=1798392 RepID=A0A1F6AIC5_9BACT|nr:MAG: hypothetical protein A3A79_04750 [Candidatus Gottesmanbacteria bacterium RIFCSPLOWO2_01_FULL_43_11b]
MKYIFILTLFLVFATHAFAYTLPYPSYMPGHKLYKISRFLDQAKAWWYWGVKSKIKYHASLADKYLVESKTLFEYQQYLLAVDALRRSNEQITAISSRSGEQMKAHTDVLERLKQMLPEEFLWQPEKETPTRLPLHILLDEALFIRNE